MERIRLTNNFFLDELVPPELYLQFGANARWFIRKEVIYLLQHLRSRHGAIVVNDWSLHGERSAEEFLSLPKQEQKAFFTESGFRLFNTGTGASFSMHKFGAAADAKFLQAKVEDVRDEIKLHYPDYRKIGMTAIEGNTKTWLHFDIRNTGSKQLLIL
jgi:hypothetical protein